MTKSPHPPVILVDGSSYLFRAYYALPPLTTDDGRPTGAVYGVVNMLKRLIKDYQPELMAVVFDSKEKNFRHQLYPDYKANRTKMPEELVAQIEPLHDIIRAMGIPLIVVDGVEADDIIATLAHQAKKKKMQTVISTGDKDFAQLVDDYVQLVNTMTGTHLNREGVIKKFGVPPESMVDYLSLMGDSVDNIPGVPKVGPKTAEKWIKQYGSLDEVIRHADEITGKVGEYLRDSIKDVEIARKLIILQSDVELSVDVKELTLKPWDTKALKEYFSKLEFRSWVADLIEKEGAQQTTSSPYQLITTKKALEEFISEVKEKKVVAIDTETTSLHIHDAELVGISMAVDKHPAVYIPVGHTYPECPPQLDRELVLSLLAPILSHHDIKKIGHHLKYDINILRQYDIEIHPPIIDSMLESYVFNSTAGRHNLDAVSLRLFDHKNITFEDVAGKGAKQVTFDQVPLEKAAPYSAEDAEMSLRAHHKLSPQFTPKQKKLLEEIEFPLVPVLARMEWRGVLLDVEELHKQSHNLAQRLRRLQEKIDILAGESVNVESPKQLQAILYEKLGLPIHKRTPTGQASTSEEVLQELAAEYELPQHIIEYRGLRKLKSTYTDPLPQQVHPKTGRVHTSYHQAVTATGRLSSSDPNLQNIPVRTEEGRQIRQCFIAPRGYRLIAADYSQIELRIMAHLSKDKGLLNAFSNGFDVHKATAAEIFNVSQDDVTDDQRRSAKTINFGLIYGMSAFGLARQLGIGRHDAQNYINLYFERYPGVLEYMNDIRHKAAEQGYVETLFGRRLYLPEIRSKQAVRRNAAERTAINAPMQGTAADIIKVAMIRMDEWLIKNKIDAHIIMQVHDELVVEAAVSVVDTVKEHLIKAMCESVELKVPVHVEVGVGQNWDEAH